MGGARIWEGKGQREVWGDCEGKRSWGKPGFGPGGWWIGVRELTDGERVNSTSPGHGKAGESRGEALMWEGGGG